MSVKRLRRELGPGELSYWIAYFSIQHDQYEQTRKDTEREAKRKAK